MFGSFYSISKLHKLGQYFVPNLFDVSSKLKAHLVEGKYKPCIVSIFIWNIRVICISYVTVNSGIYYVYLDWSSLLCTLHGERLNSSTPLKSFIQVPWKSQTISSICDSRNSICYYIVQRVFYEKKITFFEKIL